MPRKIPTYRPSLSIRQLDFITSLLDFTYQGKELALSQEDMLTSFELYGLIDYLTVFTLKAKRNINKPAHTRNVKESVMHALGGVEIPVGPETELSTTPNYDSMSPKELEDLERAEMEEIARLAEIKKKLNKSEE